MSPVPHPSPHQALPADARLRERLQARLQAVEVKAIGDHAGRRAAVAVAIAEEGGGAGLPGMPRHAAWSAEAALLLTRRAAHLKRHAGQWALPGGRLDPGETAEQAALREMDEEIGLRLHPGDVLGRLDDFATRSGYVITPVVVWAGRAQELVADPAEVHSVHRIPVRELLRADAPILEPVPDGGHPVLKMPVGRQWIAAPTAAILYQFREWCLLGRDTRVAHFDQPRFAWR